MARLRHRTAVPERQLRAVAPIEAAIDAVHARPPDQGEPQLVTLPVLPPLRPAQGGLDVSVPDGGEVVLMLVDPASPGWRPIVLPGGTSWELRQARRVWTP